MDAKKVRGNKPSRTCHVETDELLPELDGAGLGGLLGTLPGRNDTAKQANMVGVAIKRREGKSDYRTAREMGMAYQTPRGCLVRIAKRGLDGLYDRRASNRVHTGWHGL